MFRALRPFLVLLTLAFIASPAFSQTATISTLYSFCAQASCPSYPLGPLIQASDGNYYGTATVSSVVNGGNGEFFRLSPAGAFTNLYDLCPTSSNCTEGAGTNTGMIQGLDGNLYGVDYDGGANQAGGIFRLTLDGSYQLIYSFCSQANCADGGYSYAGLTLASDGTGNRTMGTPAARSSSPRSPAGRKHPARGSNRERSSALAISAICRSLPPRLSSRTMSRTGMGAGMHLFYRDRGKLQLRLAFGGGVVGRKDGRWLSQRYDDI